MVLKTRDGIEFKFCDGNIEVCGPITRFQMKNVSESIYDALQLFKNGGVEEEDAIQTIMDTTPHELSSFIYYMENMIRFGIINRSIFENNLCVASLISSSTQFSFVECGYNPKKSYRLSRFVLSRRVGDVVIIESPLGFGYIEVHNPILLSILYSMVKPKVFSEVYDDSMQLSEANVIKFLNFLHNINGIDLIDKSQESIEEENKSLKQWEFHNLLFHARSRMGRHNSPSGACYPFIDSINPSPAIKALDLKGKERIFLHKPDIESLKKNDIPFTRVLEERKSIRKDHNPPITVEQLGVFLYRSARVREVHSINVEKGQLYETSNRPYPSGGSSYELELYIVINKCQGLEKGIYYYDAMNHSLVMNNSEETYLNALLTDAWLSAAKSVHPQILITISSRFNRLNWKYRSMGYSASIKNVGVLYQTMYLVATAMGLSSCALGNGNGDLLGKAVGLDYFEESAVGEFILGS